MGGAGREDYDGLVACGAVALARGRSGRLRTLANATPGSADDAVKAGSARPRRARPRWSGAARFALLGCTVAAAACDGAFRVQGELVTPSASACRMRLHDARDGKVLRERAVRGSFDEVFTISPLPDDYYLTIACDGVPQSFKSDPVRLGSRRHYDHPLKLGKVVLGAPPKRD